MCIHCASYRPQLAVLAAELKMSVGDVLLVKQTFDTFDDDKSGCLDIDEFEELVARLLASNFKDSVAKL